MKFILPAIRFLVYTNIWIGLGAAALTFIYFLIYTHHQDLYSTAFAFFATVLTYTFQRFVKLSKPILDGGDRLKWMENYPLTVKLTLLFSGVGTVYCLVYLPITVLPVLALLGLLSFFYIVPLPSWRSNLRDIPSLKIFLIALVWATTAVLIPHTKASAGFSGVPWWLFLADFAFVLAITIPFDIRDLHLDEPEKLTIPQLLGNRNAILLSCLLLMVNYLILIYLTGVFLPFSLANTIISMAFCLGALNQPKDLYYSFGIDGLLILQTILLSIDLSF